MEAAGLTHLARVRVLLANLDKGHAPFDRLKRGHENENRGEASSFTSSKDSR